MIQIERFTISVNGERIPPISGDPVCQEYDSAGPGAGTEVDGFPQCAQCGYSYTQHASTPRRVVRLVGMQGGGLWAWSTYELECGHEWERMAETAKTGLRPGSWVACDLCHGLAHAKTTDKVKALRGMERRLAREADKRENYHTPLQQHLARRAVTLFKWRNAIQREWLAGITRRHEESKAGPPASHDEQGAPSEAKAAPTEQAG